MISFDPIKFSNEALSVSLYRYVWCDKTCRLPASAIRSGWRKDLGAVPGRCAGPNGSQIGHHAHHVQVPPISIFPLIVIWSIDGHISVAVIAEPPLIASPESPTFGRS